MGGLVFLKFWKGVSVEGAFDVFPQQGLPWENGSF